jgi:protein tyrosine/serine phosphatase
MVKTPWHKAIGRTVYAIVLISIAYHTYVVMMGNFHEVTAGEAYRSGQLSPELLQHYVQRYHIKSILNLRSDNNNQSWYINEKNEAERLNTIHYDVPLSAEHPPSSEQIEQLLWIFLEAPRPILIHCKAGADRSGLVAALWKVWVDKEPAMVAKRQLSIWYGHIPLAGTRSMDQFFETWSSRNPTLSSPLPN